MTITVEEEVARWARIEAAKQDTSISRLVGRILAEHMRHGDGSSRVDDDYEKAMRRLLGRRPYIKSSEKYPSREEIHERGRVR